MSLSPKRYTTATALQALQGAAYTSRNLTSANLVQKYGNAAKLDAMLCDQYRLAIRVRIEMAWERRRKITSCVVTPLFCYQEVAPFEENGVLKLDPTKCNVQTECCLASSLKSRPDDLQKLKKVIDGQPVKLENQRRGKVLRELFRTPKRQMTDKMCRDLGDAFFALFAPLDGVILTTNIRDHEPLARILGKKVEKP